MPYVSLALRELVKNYHSWSGFVALLVLAAAVKSFWLALLFLAACLIFFGLLCSKSAAEGYPLSNFLTAQKQAQAAKAAAVRQSEYLDSVGAELWAGLSEQLSEFRLLDCKTTERAIKFLVDFGVEGWENLDKPRLLRQMRASFPSQFFDLTVKAADSADNCAILILVTAAPATEKVTRAAWD